MAEGTHEERAHAEAGHVVDGYRLDVSRRLVAALLPGAFAAMLGAVLLLIGIQPLAAREPERFLYRRPTFQPYHPAGEVQHYMTPREQTLAFGGAMLLLLSPFVLGFGLRRLLVVEDFLVLRTDGLLRQAGTNSELVRWDDVEEVRYDEATDSVRLALRDGGEHVIRDRFTGLDQKELAKRVAEVRRKALFRLLPAQRR